LSLYVLVLQRSDGDRYICIVSGVKLVLIALYFSALDEFLEFGDNWEVDFHLASDIGVGLRFLLESLASYYLNVEMLLGLAKKSVIGVCISPRDMLGAIHSVFAEGSFRIHQPHNFNEYIRTHEP
jgi:hypothetical protein